jgi:hypothetical protein
MLIDNCSELNDADSISCSSSNSEIKKKSLDEQPSQKIKKSV